VIGLLSGMMDFFSTSCDNAFLISEEKKQIYRREQHHHCKKKKCMLTFGTASAYQGHLLPLSSIEAPSDKPHNQAMETGDIIR